MKFLLRTEGTGEASRTASIDVPNSTIAWGTVIIAVIQLAGTIGGNLIANSSKEKSDKDALIIKQENFKVQLLQRVLEDEDPKARANSILFLAKMGIMDDPNGTISKLCNDPSQIPKWNKHPLESFGGSFEPPREDGGRRPNHMSETQPKRDSAR